MRFIVVLFQGLKAIWSPYTGIVDWGVVTGSFADDFEKRGGVVYKNYPALELSFLKESSQVGNANEYPVQIKSKPNLVRFFSFKLILILSF